MDFKPVTERQRELLTQMLHHALVEIRYLCWGNKTEQAGDLADAFHNLPSGMYAAEFSFAWFRGELESYQGKYGMNSHDYLDMLNRVSREEDLWPAS